MRGFHLVVLGVCTLAGAPALAASPTETAVLGAMDTWRQATMKKDKGLFEKVYHPGLTYGHSSGLLETKAQAIEHVLTNKVTYEGIDLTDSTVKVHGSTAVLTGKMEMRQRNDDKVNVVNLVYLTVWTRTPAGWQMLARHATRPLAPTAAAPASPPAPATAQTPAAKKP